MNYANVKEYNEAWTNEDGTKMTEEEIAKEIAEYKEYRGYNYNGYIKSAERHLFTNCWVD